jgi:hypothetical protein
MFVAILLFAAAHEPAAAHQTPLHAGLTVARVAKPAKVAAVLGDLSLDSFIHWRADLASLSLDEQAEMVTALQEGGVALGDRSRLRVWASLEGRGSPTSSGNIFQRRLQEPAAAGDKGLEEDSGLSSDTIGTPTLFLIKKFKLT